MARTRRTSCQATPDAIADAVAAAEAGGAVTVTRDTFEGLLLASAGQAAAIARGAAAPARTTTREHAAPTGNALGTP